MNIAATKPTAIRQEQLCDAARPNHTTAWPRNHAVHSISGGTDADYAKFVVLKTQQCSRKSTNRSARVGSARPKRFGCMFPIVATSVRAMLATCSPNPFPQNRFYGIDPCAPLRYADAFRYIPLVAAIHLVPTIPIAAAGVHGRPINKLKNWR